MYKKSAKLSALGLMFLLCFIFGISHVEAQQIDPKIDNTFQISPLRYDWNVNLSDDKKGVIFVKNNDTEDCNIEVSTEDFSVDQNFENDTKFFVPNENHPLKAYDVINWIDVDKSPFILKAGESKEIDFSAHVPEGTPTGGYYGVIFFTKKPIEEKTVDAPAQVNVLTRLGVLLTFGVKGSQPISEKGSLKLFEPARKVFIDNPINFNAQIENSGNFPYKVAGSIDVYKFGKKLTTLEIAPKLLYPDRTRNMPIPAWNASFFELGKYEAKIHITSEDGSIILDGTTSFLIIPWKIVAIVFLIMVVAWIIFSVGIEKGKKKNKNK